MLTCEETPAPSYGSAISRAQTQNLNQPNEEKASTKAYTNKLYHVSATRLEFHIHQHHIASPTWLISTRQQQNITQHIRQQIQAIAEQELEDKDKTIPELRTSTRSNFSAAAFLALI